MKGATGESPPFVSGSDESACRQHRSPLIVGHERAPDQQPVVVGRLLAADGYSRVETRVAATDFPGGHFRLRHVPEAGNDDGDVT